MFTKPSRRITTVAVAAASVLGTGLSVDPAAAHTGGITVNEAAAQATPAAVTAGFDVAATSAAINAASQGSVGYAFRISKDGQPVGGGAGGYARRPLDGTQDMDGTPFTVDTRIEVQLPATRALLGKKAGKARLAKLNRNVLTPAGLAPTKCKGSQSASATHIYNADHLSIGGTLIGAATSGECGAGRGLLLSATDLVRLVPYVNAAAGASKGGWTTAAGQSDDGLVSWQSGDGTFPGGREVHACVASAAGHDLSIIFNAQIPGDQSPCRILLDAINAPRTAS